MDEGGEHVISLLSGHMGGANELTKMVGRSIDARPVITTATDVVHKPAADILAVKLGLEIEPFDQLKAVNGAIANGLRVAFFIDRSLANLEKYVFLASDMGLVLVDMDQLQHTDKYEAAVVITDKILYMTRPHIFLRPATLAIGLCCSDGSTSGEIYTALDAACRQIGRSRRSIAVISSAAAQEDEIGLLAVAQQMMIPMEVFSDEQMQACSTANQLDAARIAADLPPGENVCEPAALLGGQAEDLLLGKTTFGKITIAIAEVKYRWWE
jgi:cobalt-precorrin 5A hydrolase